MGEDGSASPARLSGPARLGAQEGLVTKESKQQWAAKLCWGEGGDGRYRSCRAWRPVLPGRQGLHTPGHADGPPGKEPLCPHRVDPLTRLREGESPGTKDSGEATRLLGGAGADLVPGSLSRNQ